MAKKIKTSKLVLREDNPRTIHKSKFEKLKESLSEFPEMLEIRPIVVNESLEVLGGNMRVRAAIELGIDELYVTMVKLTKEQEQEFIVKDNVAYGEWDWDSLANTYEIIDLEKWGLDVAPRFFSEEEEDFSSGESQTQRFNDYVVYFTNEEELELWFEFLGYLKTGFKGIDTISGRLLAWVEQEYREGGMMKESEALMSFIKKTYPEYGN